MSENHEAQALARWLEEHPGQAPPADVDPEVIEALYALRPDLAPAPDLRIEDILAAVESGPFHSGASARDDDGAVEVVSLAEERAKRVPPEVAPASQSAGGRAARRGGPLPGCWRARRRGTRDRRDPSDGRHPAHPEARGARDRGQGACGRRHRTLGRGYAAEAPARMQDAEGAGLAAPPAEAAAPAGPPAAVEPTALRGRENEIPRQEAEKKSDDGTVDDDASVGSLGAPADAAKQATRQGERDAESTSTDGVRRPGRDGGRDATRCARSRREDEGGGGGARQGDRRPTAPSAYGAGAASSSQARADVGAKDSASRCGACRCGLGEHHDSEQRTGALRRHLVVEQRCRADRSDRTTATIARR